MLSILKKLGYTLLITAILVLISVLVLEIASLNKVAFGVYVGDTKIGGLKNGELKNKLISILDDYKKSGVKIDLKNTEVLASLDELGLNANIEDAINSAFLVSRGRNIFSGVKNHILSLVYGHNLKIEFLFDREKFENFIKTKLSQQNIPAQDARFIYDASKTFLIIQEESPGSVVNDELLKQALLDNVSSLSKDSIKTEFKTENPEITKKELSPLLYEANGILNRAPYTISQNSKQKWEIDKDQTASWLRSKKMKGKIILSFDKDEMKDFLVQISPSINREPKNAILAIKDGRATEFKLSENGLALDIEQSAEYIEKEILRGEKNITLKTHEVLPEIRTETIENLGITSLLATGESDFAGSIASRTHNIKLGATKFNGILIKPGEEFSVINILGSTGPKEGYRAAYVIKNGKTTMEYGGGICQVSTTIFRAAMLAGLEITERFPHSYPVQYYKPQGFDAAVYGPHPDLRFINNTPSNVLVQSRIIDTKIYVDFYGTNDGREVKITGPVEYDKKPDGSLKAKLTREISKNGELAESKTFYSNYKSPKLYPTQRNPLE